MHLDHLNLYVSDLQRSRHFYEAILHPFGFEVVRDFPDVAVGFGRANYSTLALVYIPDQVQSTHLAFRVERRLDVDRFYDIALQAGATDNGSPGVRPHYHDSYYAAFVRDPDRHNLEVVCHEPPA